MAATDVEKLIVSFEARINEYMKSLAKLQGQTVSQLKKAEKAAESFATRFDRKLGSIGKDFMRRISFLSSAAGIGLLARTAQQTIKSIADIGDAADKIGLTTDQYQEMAFVAKLAGVETDALANFVKKLGINTADAQRGVGEFGDLLKANNISLVDSNGKLKSQAEILKIVAELTKNAASEQDALRVATIAGGKGGAETMGLLMQGAAGVEKAMGQARDAGVSFSEEQIRKAQDFDDRLDTLIEKISVGLKGSFLDAATGAEIMATRANAALDSIGIKSGAVSQSLLNILKYNPFAASTTLAMQGLSATGRGAGGSIPMDPQLAGRAAGSILSGPGKGDIPTKLPDPEEIQRRKQLADEIERQVKAVGELVSNLEFEAAQLKKSELQQQIDANLRKAGAHATEEQRKAIIAHTTATYEHIKAQEVQEFRLERQRELYEQQQELIEGQQQSLRSLTEMGVAGFEAWALRGEKLSDVINNLAQSLASAALQAAVLGQGPLAGLMGGGGGGLFGSFFGNGAITSLYHKGGVVGSGNGMSRAVSPLAFAGAPRMHGGGFAGLRMGEVPAILQKGEMVLPRGFNKGQGAAARVVINNFTGEKVQTRQRRDGTTQIDVGSMVANAILSGKADDALRDRFGMSHLSRRR